MTNTTSMGTENPPLKDLVLILGRLGCIGRQPYPTNSFPSHRKLSQALARNRSGFRIISTLNARDEKKGGKSGRFRFVQELWPIVLAKRAIYLFRPYPECNDKSCDCQRLTKEAEALFGLLVAFGNEIIGDGRKPPVNEDESINSDDFVVVGDTSDADDREDC